MIESTGEVQLVSSDRISCNYKVMMGKPVVMGTRVTVEWILERLAAGESETQIPEGFGRNSSSTGPPTVRKRSGRGKSAVPLVAKRICGLAETYREERETCKFRWTFPSPLPPNSVPYRIRSSSSSVCSPNPWTGA